MTSDDKRTRITTTRLSGRRAALKRIIATAPSERRAATQSLLLESGKRPVSYTHLTLPTICSV